MFDYIRDNISWLKDLFTFIFVGTGTVVAILTYRRARATILQPIRTEVIKKQSELLSGLLQILKEYNHSFEAGLDYLNLVQMNVLLALKDYGFVFKENKELSNKINNNLAGWIPCGNSNTLKDIEIVGTFTEKTGTAKANDYGVQKFNNLKNRKIDIDKIYLTKEYTEFTKIISEFRENPFMPTSIQETLTELNNDIKSNLSIFLKSELEIFMLDFSKEYFEKHHAPHFDPVGVYNSFNHARVHHRATLDKLRKEIRKYLRIDEGW
jgi:hypothetical protein